MAISMATKREDSQRIVEIEGTINDYLNAKSEFDSYIHTGLRMDPDAIRITIKNRGEN